MAHVVLYSFLSPTVPYLAKNIEWKVCLKRLEYNAARPAGRPMSILAEIPPPAAVPSDLQRSRASGRAAPGAVGRGRMRPRLRVRSELLCGRGIDYGRI